MYFYYKLQRLPELYINVQHNVSGMTKKKYAGSFVQNAFILITLDGDVSVDGNCDVVL